MCRRLDSPSQTYPLRLPQKFWGCQSFFVHVFSCMEASAPFFYQRQFAAASTGYNACHGAWRFGMVPRSEPCVFMRFARTDKHKSNKNAKSRCHPVGINRRSRNGTGQGIDSFVPFLLPPDSVVCCNGHTFPFSYATCFIS